MGGKLNVYLKMTGFEHILALDVRGIFGFGIMLSVYLCKLFHFRSHPNYYIYIFITCVILSILY